MELFSKRLQFTLQRTRVVFHVVMTFRRRHCHPAGEHNHKEKCRQITFRRIENLKTFECNSG